MEIQKVNTNIMINTLTDIPLRTHNHHRRHTILLHHLQTLHPPLDVQQHGIIHYGDHHHPNCQVLYVIIIRFLHVVRITLITVQQFAVRLLIPTPTVSLSLRKWTMIIRSQTITSLRRRVRDRRLQRLLQQTRMGRRLQGVPHHPILRENGNGYEKDQHPQLTLVRTRNLP